MRPAIGTCSRTAAGIRIGYGRWKAATGSASTGRLRLVADGESVVDVSAKLSARARVFSTGQGRKTDATDAHCIAVVALRTPGLVPRRPDDHQVVVRMLADRRGRTRRRPHRHSHPACTGCCWS